MTADQFRRIALGMAGASEGQHMGHPDFRVNGRIFATLTADGSRGMVQLMPEQQQEFVSANPDTFVPAAGAWGRGGSTMVDLAKVNADTLGEAMTLAWQKAVAMKKSKTKPRPKPKPKRR